MKVLFAVNNENISESIIKQYQKEYKEIISSKNVYYFNAIAKELQNDKTYDRIVISEDLEPFANNNYEIIDKFIFEKLDDISDEATNTNGQDIPIILICADRRTKSEALLIKIFGIGIYSALLGQDRTIENVCELINQPRTKKDAKVYYNIDSEDVDYKTESEGDVSEVEIQNILSHYRRLGKNEDKYVESFDNIAAQYTDAQLKVICKFLPLNVKAVLELESSKYQELITFGAVSPGSASKGSKKTQKNEYVPNSDYQAKKNSTGKNGGIEERKMEKLNLSKPVVIPEAMDINNVKKVDSFEEEPEEEEEELSSAISNYLEKQEDENDTFDQFEDLNKIIKPSRGIESLEEIEKTEPVKEIKEIEEVEEEPIKPVEEKKRRGRPKKVQTEEEIRAIEETPKKKRGRPKKVQEPEKVEPENMLPEVEEEPEDNVLDGMILPGFDNEPSMNENTNSFQEEVKFNQDNGFAYNNSREIENTNQVIDLNMDRLLTGDKKIVAFVGTSKNGTSFLVNNLADVLSNRGIKTAILDLTKNKNAYYIYTQNEENLRRKAFSCIDGLKNGIADGIQINKNLTVYTTLPDDNQDLDSYTSILSTLAQNYSLVLMDCDFETNYGYFEKANEIYLVQSYDILTIQPLTAFLRNLKTKGVLAPEKLRIVLNKVLRVRCITERTIIGGIAFYNDPAMSFMTELFNKDTIQYCTIPFEEQTYSRYLEGLVNCKISTNGYSKIFMDSLNRLSNMVYPLLSNRENRETLNSYQPSGFSNNMNDILNKMKRNN